MSRPRYPLAARTAVASVAAAGDVVGATGAFGPPAALPGARDRLVAVAEAVHDGAFGYALAVAWDAHGAAWWAACDDAMVLAELAALADPAAGRRAARAVLHAALAAQRWPAALPAAWRVLAALEAHARAAERNGPAARELADALAALEDDILAPTLTTLEGHVLEAVLHLAELGVAPDARAAMVAASSVVANAVWISAHAGRRPGEDFRAVERARDAQLAALAPAARAAAGAAPTVARLLEVARGA